MGYLFVSQRYREYVRVKINTGNFSNIITCIDSKTTKRSLCCVNQIEVDFFIQACLLIELLESFTDAFNRIYKIENIGVLFARVDTVDTAQSLNSLHITKLFVNNHRVKKRLIKACLIF